MKIRIYTVPPTQAFEDEKAYIQIGGKHYPIQNNPKEWANGNILFIDLNNQPLAKEAEACLYEPIELPR